ncbi:MAG: hypothetical protein L0H73_03440 [Nitrococcus sp.]|nr:hypothetical protein [Nitrococcus sp.]
MAETPAEEKIVKDAVLLTLEAEHAKLASVNASGDPDLEGANLGKLAKELKEVNDAIRALPAQDSLFDLLARIWEGWDVDTDPAAGEGESWLESNPYGPMVLQCWREWSPGKSEEQKEFIPWLRGVLREQKPGQLWEEYRSFLKRQSENQE